MSRIFQNFTEAVSELRRDLAELSTKLGPTTWQGRSVAEDSGYVTNELQNYLYTVTNPEPDKGLEPTQSWVEWELYERLRGCGVNPGEAYKRRLEVWGKLLEEDGKFSYTYSERLYGQLPEVVNVLREHNFSRQIFLGIWDSFTDPYQLEKHRVPCSLGYYLQFRGGRLNMTYLQRSCDFITHYHNDVWLAVKMLEYIAEEAGLPRGMFSHWIGSLHVFEKDVRGVF